jgi:cell division protein FtsI (penicillin-binding protein 3)
VRVFIFVAAFVVAVLLSLGVRCFYLQHARRDHYRSLSLKQQQKLVNQNAQRGEILDCCGRVLAASNRFQIIKAEPRVIEDPASLAVKLAPVVNIEAIEICDRITGSQNPGFVRIKVNAGREECRAASKLYGIGVESEWARYYPMGSLAAHVVGFTSLDNRGLDGVELQCNSELCGLGRRSVFLADVSRRPIRLIESGYFHNGNSVVLTIDATIQQFTRSELMKQYQSFEAESAIAVVAEPKTGAILAMVSLPDFDPTDVRNARPENLRNRVTTDQFEPGSIFKPIVAAIAMDAGVVNRTGTIFCENGFYHGKGFGRISEYQNHRYGDMTVRDILVKSSNIGMAKIGQRLGSGRLYKGLSLFGLGKETGIDLPAEASGLLRPPNAWTGYSVTRIPFGQEITVTAMQLVKAYCILANGGRLVRPYVIRAMIDNDGGVIKLNRSMSPGVGYIVSPEVAKWIISDAMTGVVNKGTGTRAQLEKWQVFGKTGTANIALSNARGYSEDDYIASFVAGAPAEDPAILVLVSIRKPNKRLGKGYTGGAVAAPVAGAIIEKTLTYLHVEPTKKQDVQVARD